MNSIVIGCDSLAIGLRDFVAGVLTRCGIEVESVNDALGEGVDYPVVAEAVCERIIESGHKKRGVLMCGTGIGMAMTANKFRGIRAAVCHDIYSAERSILSNQSNVLCLGARVVGLGLAERIVEEWISLEFIPGPSSVKVREMQAIESRNLKGPHRKAPAHTNSTDR